MYNSKSAAILLAALIAMLYGCGGGGGSSPAAPVVVVDPNLTVPFQTAVANLVNNGINKTYTLSGYIDNSTTINPIPPTPISGSGTLTIGSPTGVTISSGPLIGVAALKVVAVLDGATTSTSTTYYSASNYTILVTADTNTLYYSPYTYPSTVKAGDTGTLGSATTGGIFATTVTSVYSVASDSANSLLVTVTDTEQSGGGGTVIAKTVYRITTSGNIALLSITVSNYFMSSIAYAVHNFTFA